MHTKEIIATRESYAINPVYAIKGDRIDAELYKQFEPWIEDHLDKIDKDNIKMMIKNENYDTEEVFTSVKGGEDINLIDVAFRSYDIKGKYIGPENITDQEKYLVVNLLANYSGTEESKKYILNLVGHLINIY